MCQTIQCCCMRCTAHCMIQGGGPCRPSPKRHSATGQMRRQRITIKTERQFIIYPLYIEGGKQSAKTHKQSPCSGGTHTRHTIWCWASKQSNNPPSPCITASSSSTLQMSGFAVSPLAPNDRRSQPLAHR